MKREYEKVSMIYLDIDGFKNANDVFGHHVGDKILKELARIIRESIRKTDVPARIGGDEFCIFIFGSKNRFNRVFTERIVEKFNWVSRNNK